MTDLATEEDLTPVAHVTLVYNGPVAPHWEMKVRYGDTQMLDDFWNRVRARLLLLPKHDPQFRRNRERVNRDAERELITCDWDLGEGDAETTSTPVRQQAAVETTPVEAAPVDAVPVDDAADEVTPGDADTPAVEVDDSTDLVADASDEADAADNSEEE